MGYECLHTDQASEALTLMRQHEFDLFLLDIFITGELDGVELAHEVRAKSDSPLIFITSYFDAQTLDRVKPIKPEAYIVKPFEERNLTANIELALYHHRKPKNPTTVGPDKVFIKDQGELIALNPEEIIYIEADDNYSNIHTIEKRYLLSHPIKRIEEKVQNLPFVRVHKSYIVNLTKVTSIQEGFIFLGESRIPLGRTYRQDFMNALTIL